jgi:glycosyltransferase involved in cell wall biosynthesis
MGVRSPRLAWPGARDDCDRRGVVRIVVIAPPWYEIPPEAYGGVESMSYYLVEGLTGRGHEVTLIGAGRDQTSADFIPTYRDPPVGLGRPEAAFHELLHAARAEQALRELEYDVVHDHTFAGPLAAHGRTAPTLMTIHGPPRGEILEYYRALSADVSMVAISGSQRRMAPDLPWLGTVHNGIAVEEYPFRAKKEDFVLFLGRMNPDKGAHVAIEAARAAGRRLVLAGKCSEDMERRYFEDEVRPRLGPDVEWIEEADAERKKELCASARCLLFPIQWEEPFGMVMIEAMACGTPVVALERGSVPEVVLDGVTGFVMRSAEELPGAIDRVDELDPFRCRAHVQERFDVSRMVDGYQAMYRQMTAAPVRRRDSLP